MSRRLIASLSVVVAGLLAVATIALASGDSAPVSGTGTAAAAPGAAAGTSAVAATQRRPGGRHGFGGRVFGHGGPMFGMLKGLVLRSAADRLGVSADRLEAAVKAVAADQFDKQAAAAKLTDAEKQALADCRAAFGGRHGAKGTAPGTAKTCDRATAAAAIKKLRALPKPDLAALRTELSDALGAELGITGAKVLEAARAELSDRLDQGVKAGFLTADGKAKALACFDAPASCDLKALRGSLLKGHMRFGGPGRHGSGQRRGHGTRRSGARPAARASGRRA